MKNILEEIMEDFFQNGEIPADRLKEALSVECSTDENGDYVIRCKNPHNNKDYKEAKEYLDSVDDDILMEAIAPFKKADSKAYDTICEQVEYPYDIKAFVESVNKFKPFVASAAQKKITALQEAVTDLQNKYGNV